MKSTNQIEKLWKNSDIYLDNYILYIRGEHVMNSDENILMKEMTEILKNCDGKIVEAGYGMGISAKYLDSYENIKTHTIVEANKYVYDNLINYANTVKNTEIIPVFDLFENWILKESNESYDGVFFDTYPINCKGPRFDDSTIKNFKEIYRILKFGGLFTFYDNYVYDINLIKKHLIEVGFLEENIKFKYCSIPDPNISHFKIYDIKK